jgi:uncharacterized protein
MQQDPNYGRPEEPQREPDGSPVGGPIGSTTGTTTGMSQMNAQDERTWSMIAHLSVLALLIGLMPFGALIVWLIYKDKSPRVRFHAAQALWYQIAWVVILVAWTFLSIVLTLVLIGFLMFFLLPLLVLVPLVHGCYAAYQVNQGIDYRYPFIADYIDGGRRVA